MKIFIKKLFILSLFIMICIKELTSLPSPIYFFKIFFNTDSNMIQFILWIFLVFVFTPAMFYNLMITWNLKYGFIEPENVYKLVRVSLKSYLIIMLDSIIIQTVLFYLTYCDDIFLYTLLRYSSMFPMTALSNAIYIQLFVVICIVFSTTFLVIAFQMAGSIIIRVSNLSNLQLFLQNNKEYLIGIMSISCFYFFNIYYVYFKISDVSNETAELIKHMMDTAIFLTPFIRMSIM